ncbi:AMP-binding protein [Massilia forsythiae]|uniref:AMP-binding protein n=1 Tax=Massilia forsythiae TaxID=2728020 RepID=A0A7Z2ZRU9_9BURK|nr:AMP-binding protein [Massilia forsythiae]QJD99499.1 AMP-binding protein [Massilia forsythiae]
MRDMHGTLELLTDRLRHHAQAAPERLAYTFLRDDGKIDEITYGQLEQRASRMARALAERAAPGSRALLLYPAGLEFIVVYLACQLAGLIAVPATIPHKSRASRRLRALLEDADPALILTRVDSESAIKASLSLVDAAHRAVLTTDALEPTYTATPLPPVDPDAIAFLQYTSGSTALPKGVEVTHRNIASNVESIRNGFGFTPDTVMVSWLPLFHDMGLIGSVVSPLHVGFHCVLMAPAAFLKNPLAWLQAISRYRGTCAGAPNFGWDYCARRVQDSQKAGLDLSSLKVAYNGSEPVRAATLRAFVDAFAACGMRDTMLFPCYGMAETTLFVSGGPIETAPVVMTVSKSLLEGNQIRNAAPDDEDAREIVSSGRIGSGTRVAIVDPETHLPVSNWRVGEIWVSGPSVTRGYWMRPDVTEATFGARLAKTDEGPFLRTGDLGFIRDGELFITGRLKDLIIINGRNVYPQDVEEVIERAIDFIEPNMCAAFSVEIQGQERLAIVAEANRSLVRAAQHAQKTEHPHTTDAYLAQIEASARAITSVISQQFDVSVSSIVFVRPGSFPRTTSGKVQRSRCKELALLGQLELVWVMPGSLFDRRSIHADADVPAAPALPATPAAPAAEAPAALDAPDAPASAPGTDAAGSRARADAMIAWLRQYAERRINSRVIDERRTVPPYVVLDLGNQGFFGLQAPLQYGGRDLATVDLMRVLEQLAAVDMTVATMVGVHNGLGIRPLLRFAAPALRERLLPALASGRQMASFGLTEPDAGSNPMALRASAMRTEGGWRVSGEKQWIGLASWAGVTTVFAKATDAGGAPLGISAITVEADNPGLVQGPESLTMGMRGMVQNTVFLEDAFVPDGAMLLSPGEGMEVARDAMLFSRLGIGGICVGAMKRCAQLMARYAARRDIATGKLAANPVTVARLQGLGSSIFAVEALVYAIAGQVDQGAAAPAEAYLACKTAATEALGSAADQLVQMLGGRGYIETNAAPQILRDARVLRILEGPTETLYAHLGASASHAGGPVESYLGETLGRPALAAELGAAIARVRAAADGGARLFPTQAALGQWLDYRLGELTARAFLLAAAERKQLDGPCDQQAASDAVAWARRRFSALAQELVAEMAANRPHNAADALLAMVDGYAAAIGDIDQRLPGETQFMDPLLRRDGGAARHAAQHLPRQAQQQGQADGTAGVEDSVANDAGGGGAPDAAAAGASAATRAVVHECVMRWLRSEARRDVVQLDDDTPFTTLGMDSLATATIAVDLEQQLGMAILPELLFDYQSVELLAAFIDSQRARP